MSQMVDTTNDDRIRLANGKIECPCQKKKCKLSISVLGNISSGKTTLTQLLTERKTPSVLLAEPVQMWQKNGLLGEFYTDIDKSNPNRGINRRSVIFQTYAFISRLILYNDIKDDPTQYIIQDSHILPDRYCFARKLHEDEGLISDTELEWYNQMFEMWTSLCPMAIPDIFLYIRTDPSVCFERNLIRQKICRPEESSITLTYLEGLHKYYEDLIKMDFIKPKLIIIDGNKSDIDVLNECLDIINKTEKNLV